MKLILLVLFLSASVTHAQKTVTKSITNPEIEFVTLDVTNVFQLSIATVQTDEMVLEAGIDGEYSKDVLLNVKETGKTLFISTEFQPNFKKPNDKLSAHKVISVALKVLLPEQKRVRIFGNECNIQAKGSYSNLKIILSEGRCHLESISGTAEVRTQSGNISVLAKSAKIIATSKYGRVVKHQMPLGDAFFDLSSVTGDILLDKKE